MQVQKVITYKSFDEWDEETQETILDANRDYAVYDEFWHECVIDSMKEAGAMIGIDIDRIYFSGFCNQGDGACFEGDYAYKKGALKAVKAEYPQWTDIHRIAKELQDIQKTNFYGLSASVSHSGHYYHELCTDISVYDREGEFPHYQIEENLSQILREFMQEIYSNLQKEYEHLTSDDYLSEWFCDSDLLFNESGEIY